MMPDKKREFLHSYLLIIISIITIVLFFLPIPLFGKFLIWLLVIIIYLQNGLELSKAFKLVFISLFFSFTFVLLNFLYPAKRLMYGDLISFFGISFYKNVLWNGVNNFLRIFFLSHLSMSSSFAISYTKVILYLIVNKKIKASFGYPLLIAMNSIELFKEEFIKIRIATKYRGMGFYRRLFILFPLLVFAIRQAQRGAMSLVTRGLQGQKSYYFQYEIKSSDKRKFIYLLLSLLGLVALAIII